MLLDLSLDNNVLVTNIWDAAIQEINILFNTNNTELIGYPEFGTDFYRYLWGLSANTNGIRSYIEDLLHNCTYLNMLKYNVEVNCTYNPDSYDLTYVVKINVYSNELNKDIELTYNLGDLLYINNNKKK